MSDCSDGTQRLKSMVQAAIILLIIGLIIAGILIQPVLVRRRRDRIKRRSFPPLWNAIIANHLPIYAGLAVHEQKRLQGHIQVFLAEKQFIGCAGLQVTEEMKLTIAAIACLLLFNEQEDYFPRLRSILLYPGAYFVNETTAAGNYVVEERRVLRLGESWANDQVILSWDQVKYDTQNWNDGHNVVLHEFAHQLDQANGSAEGVPSLQENSDYSIWAQVMTEEYRRLRRDVQRGIQSVLDSYGATNPAEFFAVATETFFEKSHSLLKYHPRLYEQLHHYYQLDPVEWVKRPGR